jgi:hypothetical protein
MADITNPPIINNNNGQDPKFPKAPLVGSSIYDLDYFSPSQCFIYIGDVWVDETVGFSFQVQQSKTPIYGYASQLFDAVAPGQVIVQGSFTVNFKESGYLWLVLHRYKRFEKNVDQVVQKWGKISDTTNIAKKKQGSGKILLGGTNNPFTRIRNNNGNQDFISRAGIERLVSGEATKDERTAFYNSLAGYATSNNPNNRDAAFENIVEVFEDQVWQDNVNDLDSKARRVDDNSFDDFDIFMVYGDYTKPGANHTVRRIRNVSLIGQSQQIMLGPDNIVENYNFIAKNII